MRDGVGKKKTGSWVENNGSLPAVGRNYLCKRFHQYRASTFRTYNDFAYKLAATALAYVDGNRIAGYLEGGGTDAA